MSKNYRAYKKMHNKHQKELKKLIKADAEWDWCFLHELVITKIRHMYEYYAAGNNVWQVDESRLQIVEQLKHVLDLLDELEHLFDNIPDPEAIFNEDGTLTLTSTEDSRATRDKAYKREDEIYKEIYTYIGEHLREWWD